MKSHSIPSLLIIFSFFSLPIFAQSKVQMKDGLMMVQEVKSIESMDSIEIFENTLKWAKESDIASLEVKNSELGKIITGSGVIKSTHFLGSKYSELVFDMKIEFKDGRFRFTCTQILIRDFEGKTISLETQLYSNTKEEIKNGKAKKFRAEADRAFAEMERDLMVFLKMDGEFSDW